MCMRGCGHFCHLITTSEYVVYGDNPFSESSVCAIFSQSGDGIHLCDRSGRL